MISLTFTDAMGQAKRRGVEGVVLDTAQQPIRGVSVTLTSVVDTMVTATDDEGHFYFKGVLARDFQLTFRILGFEALHRDYLVGSGYEVIPIIPIILNPHSIFVKEVQISHVQAVILKGDTVQYNLEAYDFRNN